MNQLYSILRDVELRSERNYWVMQEEKAYRELEYAQRHIGALESGIERRQSSNNEEETKTIK